MEDSLQIIIAVVFLLVLAFFVTRILVKPIKIVIKILYNSLFGLVLLWLYNYLGEWWDLVLPINLITVAVVALLGIPGLLLLIVIKLLFGLN